VSWQTAVAGAEVAVPARGEQRTEVLVPKT